MSTALELVYEYRHLMGKCQSVVGLTMDEIEALEAIRAMFGDDVGGAVGREGSGLKTTLRGRGGKLCDEVRLSSIRLDRLELTGSPWVDAGSMVELVIEDAELMLSYRFKGRIAWARDEKGGAGLGLDIVGVPVLVRRGPRSAVPARIPAADSVRRIRISGAVAA